MSERRGWRGLRVAAIAAAALALAGCAADYVGEDWQCPLAQGSVCASVAAADPAVPESRGRESRAAGTHGSAARNTASRPGDGPSYRPRRGGATAEADGAPGCASECDPLAWLAGLFDGPYGGGRTGETVAFEGRPDDAPAQPEIVPAGTAAIDTPASETSGVVAADSAAKDAGSAPPRSNGADAGRGDAAAGDAVPLPGRDAGPNDTLRVPETVARVWIAPWVDADGIYREGSYVRAVIAPAEWRPR